MLQDWWLGKEYESHDGTFWQDISNRPFNMAEASFFVVAG
jgi:hypothetical protein